MDKGVENCSYCHGEECIHFYTSFDGQQKGCRPPSESEKPTSQHKRYFAEREQLLSRLLQGASLLLVGSVSRDRATIFSDIDLVVGSNNERLIQQIEEEINDRSRFRFHLWPS